MDVPRVWTGCLGCYNAGRLVGVWTDADQIPTDPETWAELVENPTGETIKPGIYDTHEELWVFDHEGWGGLLKGECSPADAAARWEVLAQIPEHDRGAFAAYVGLATGTGDLGDYVSAFEDAYCGEWGSREEYAENLAEDIGAVDPHASWPNVYIDWGRAARDLFLDYYDVPAPDGGIYVYRAC